MSKEAWYTQNAGTWSKTHATDVRHKLNTYILPSLGSKPIVSITVQDLLSNFKPMILQNILPSLDKARIVIGQIFQYALSLGEASHNIALEPLALLWTTFKSVKQRYGAAFMNRIVAYEIEIRYKSL